MKLMRKIVIIFIVMTLITSALYFIIGQSLVDFASNGELDRGPGRMNGAMGKVSGEISKITSQAREVGEQMEIFIRIQADYGEEKANEYIKLEKKLEKMKSSQILLVNKDGMFKEILSSGINDNNEEIEIDRNEIDKIAIKSKEILEKPENRGKMFDGGIITTETRPYVVGMKKLRVGERSQGDIVLIVNPMDEAYVQFLSEITGRTLGVYKENELGSIICEDPINLYNKEFHYNDTPEEIYFYLEIETIGQGPKYYFRMVDDREVRNNATRYINILIMLSIIIMIIANLLIYFLIKKKVLKRILNINSIVNEVAAGEDLSIELQADVSGDEISTLTTDINKMFNRLKVYSDNLEYMGSHDLLTSLINRHKLMEYITCLKEAGEEFSLFFIDLDNFKGINDTLGHNAGDALLCKISKEILDYCNETGLKVSRIGGDEFLIVRSGVNDDNITKEIGDSVLKKINRLYEFSNYSYDVKASMGISYYPQHSEDEVELLQYADIAMYCSKGKGGNSHTIFENYMLKPLELESKIKIALDNNEFKVFYQPIYNVEKNQVMGAEALIRWYSSEGMISPNSFIYLAKKTGDIVGIDTLVLNDAISTCKEWIENGHKDFYISINASRKFLMQSNIYELIREELKSKNVPPNCLKLEITEDEIIDDVEYTVSVLNRIKEMGVRVSLDDFGVGYSSFQHIKMLPLDTIKIDRSLIENIEIDNKSKSIVTTMVTLCKSLNLSIICEGIEDRKQVEILKDLGCNNIQGYYFSRPLPKDEFNKLR
ncbi:MAG: EAL domain-containing protein [Clostridium sp.]